MLGVMGRVEGNIATGKTCPIEGNKPLTEGNGSFFELLVCCFGQFFTGVLCPFAKYLPTIVR